MNYLFYDTCALLEAQQTIFENKEDKILISNITINELVLCNNKISCCEIVTKFIILRILYRQTKIKGVYSQSHINIKALKQIF